MSKINSTRVIVIFLVSAISIDLGIYYVLPSWSLIHYGTNMNILKIPWTWLWPRDSFNRAL